MGILQRYFHRPRQLAVRRLNFLAHLWAGIALTLYLILIGVSGSILVFRAELERHSRARAWPRIQAGEPVADIATIVRNLQAAFPASHIVSVDAPTENEGAFVAMIEGPGRIKVASGPIEGEVLGEFPRGPHWLDVTLELHESLLIRRTGRVWNGVGAAFLLLLNLTGLIVWWPGIGIWKRALKVDFARSWRRINFDLHSAVGFWTILITSFWAVSGIYFAWPRQVFLLVNSLSPIITARPPVIRVTPGTGPDLPSPNLSLMVSDARALDPGATFGGIVFPYGRRAPLAVLMRRGNDIGREYVDTLYFNPYDGNYISIWRYGVNKTIGDWIIWSQVPWHFGTYWGLGVKMVWALAGLAIPLLAVTGLVMYWNRVLRRKWKRLRPGATSRRAPATH